MSGLSSLPMPVLGALFLAFGYLLGSIAFGLILTKLAGTEDLRGIGSGNIGATNVLRTGRKDLAAATLLFDALKGTLAVFIASYFGQFAAICAGAGAFFGHLYPVWLKFKGGKGVATYLGVLLGFSGWAALIFAAVWIAFAIWKRFSSLAALMASLVSPFAVYGLGIQNVPWLFLLLTVILWWKHQPNIERLMQGTEPRIGNK